VPALYTNGAVGDVSPRRHGETEQEVTGRSLANAVRAAWANATPEPVGGTPLAVRATRVQLPSPAVSLQHCAARWIPSRLRVPLGSFLPRETELVAVALGRLAWVTMPGEPVTALGREIKDTARQRWTHAFVAGLSNDYLGYFVRPDDYPRPGYVTCAAIYGPQVGACLVDTSLTLLDDLTKDAPKLRRPGRAASPCDFASGAR
jgi:hypothetical protein